MVSVLLNTVAVCYLGCVGPRVEYFPIPPAAYNTVVPSVGRQPRVRVWGYTPRYFPRRRGRVHVVPTLPMFDYRLQVGW